jgi:coenzyme F420-reducing hydrogenase delta subunit
VSVVKTLNDNLGVLITAAIINLFAYSILSYAAAARIDVRVTTLEGFMLQQQQINAAQIKISENVAVMVERQTWMQREIDGIAKH